MHTRHLWEMGATIGLIVTIGLAAACFVERQASAVQLKRALDRKDTRAALAALEAGADPNYQQFWAVGEAPLIAAARTGNLEATKALLAKGAKVNITEAEDGGAALHHAIWSSPDVTRVLLKAGANPNATYMGGLTTLMRIAECDDERMSEFNLLLHFGADIRASDNRGVTVLMHIAGSPGDRVGMVKRLLSLGVDVRAVDGDGKTALDHAKGNGTYARNEGCIEALTQAE